MSFDTKLTKDKECESVDSTKYRGMIGLWYPKGTDKGTVVYVDSDHARDYVDRKSTSDICTFVGCYLTSWFSKKQTALAISTTEAEYGACVFTDKWSLDELAYGVPTDGPYQANPPSPDDIISYIRIDREGQVCCIRHVEEIDVRDHQILAREIVLTLKPLEEIIRENVFCLCYMLYCLANSEKFNLSYYMTKQIELVTKQSRLILPYGMLLTRLFKFVTSESFELSNESYVLYDRVMNHLPLIKSERLKRIVAQEEFVTPLLLPPPSINHPPLILTMIMMRMAKGPRVQALLPPFALLTLTNDVP
nr:retrovirus-related Pol polyprotein from transposon TNT 1-94 [Tanacetum cinerariifolium]